MRVRSSPLNPSGNILAACREPVLNESRQLRRYRNRTVHLRPDASFDFPDFFEVRKQFARSFGSGIRCADAREQGRSGAAVVPEIRLNDDQSNSCKFNNLKICSMQVRNSLIYCLNSGLIQILLITTVRSRCTTSVLVEKRMAQTRYSRSCLDMVRIQISATTMARSPTTDQCVYFE